MSKFECLHVATPGDILPHGIRAISLMPAAFKVCRYSRRHHTQKEFATLCQFGEFVRAIGASLLQIATRAAQMVPLSLRERAGVRDSGKEEQYQSSALSPIYPHPNPPGGRGDYNANRS